MKQKLFKKSEDTKIADKVNVYDDEDDVCNNNNKSVMTVRLFLTILNGGICILGDYLVDVNQKSPILMAIYDNLTHAIVGYLGTFVIIFSTVHRTNAIERIYLVGLGTLLSSLIDIDHFIVGRTFKLSVNILN